MICGRTRDMKAMAERELDNYDEEMVDDLTRLITDHLSGMAVEDIDEDDIIQIFYEWQETLPDADEWAMNQVENACIDAAEAKYEMQRGN